MERPKNGTKRASILHSWLISKWTWASSRHIFRIFPIHTHSEVSPPLGGRCISAKSHQIGVFPLSAPAECLDTGYLMHHLSTTSSFHVKTFIDFLLDLYFFGNVEITFEACPFHWLKRRLSCHNLLMLKKSLTLNSCQEFLITV